MAKILSPQYLEYLGTQKSVTGKPGKIDAHHEAIFPGFSRGKKKWNDFQALPLSHDEHINGRHVKGYTWWEEVGVDPKEALLKTLLNYQNSMKMSWFPSGEEYDAEHVVLDEHIQILKEMMEEEDGIV